MKRTRKPGAGRPLIAKTERKEKVVRVRLTEDDLDSLAILHSVSNHKSLSDLIRRILYKEPVLIQIKEDGLEDLSNRLYHFKRDLFNLLKSRKASVEAIRDKTVEIQDHLSVIEDALDKAKYHSMLMEKLTKSE